jgi:hypothetical protein
MNTSPDPNEQSPAPPSDGWERHELEQMRRLARLSFVEKLDWLEQAQRVAEQLRRRSEDRQELPRV